MEDHLPYHSKYFKFDKIILTLMLTLYPVGLLMMLIRVLVTHVHHSRRGRNHRLFGWFWVYSYFLLEGLLYLVYDSNIPEEAQSFVESVFLFGLILITPAIICFVMGHLADSKFDELLDQYSYLVIKRKIREIDHIAVETKQSPNHVIRDLDFMITEHMLPFGRIQDGILELEPYEEDDYYYDGYDDDCCYYDDDEENEDPARGPISMECPSCGARIIVNANDAKECDYCGNVISA